MCQPALKDQVRACRYSCRVRVAECAEPLVAPTPAQNFEGLEPCCHADWVNRIRPSLQAVVLSADLAQLYRW